MFLDILKMCGKRIELIFLRNSLQERKDSYCLFYKIYKLTAGLG